MEAHELNLRCSIAQLKSYNKILSDKINSLNLEHHRVLIQQEAIIKKEVDVRTKEYVEIIKDKDLIIKDKDSQIEALKRELAKKQSIIDNDSTNSGLPTSKTPIGKKKYIPNTREKSNKVKGGQIGHKKHKLQPFKVEEATEIVEITPKLCPKCQSEEIEKLETSVDKQELDYDVILIKRIDKFINCKCKECGHEFHSNIPNDLKEDIQYGKTLQSLAVCLTNEIYTPFNKTVKLVSGITNGEINMSEGYVTKLQKRAAQNLNEFIDDLKKYIPKQEVYGWDDGVVSINQKEGILRTYCTDNVVLFTGHQNKNEKSLDEDGILLNTSKDTIVMHDHIIHNYNEKYNFENVECMIHLIRRLKKMENNTHHNWCIDLINLLTKTNTERNKLLKEDKDSFSKEYLEKLDNKYNEIINKAKDQNKESITENYFKDEEGSFIKDLVKYKNNYLLWAYDFRLPSTNNNSERNIRPIKSKLKISGEFQSIEYLNYYATIRSYIETCKKNNINIIEACVRLMNNKPYTLNELLCIN